MSITKALEPKWNTETKLARVAWLSAKDPQKEFTSLMHFYNEESLLKCYQKLDRKKAVGIDTVTKDQYGKNIPVYILTSATYLTGYKFGVSTEEEKEWLYCDEIINKPAVTEDLIEKIKNYYLKKEDIQKT